MELDGNSNGESSMAFLSQLRKGHPGPLKVIWDNAPAHRVEVLREYLRTPGLNLQLVNLPGYSPDFNADEAVWAGQGRRQQGIYAWGPRPGYRSGSGPSSPG